jgi:hypothetical protein
MNWEAVGAVAEILWVLAVLSTLVYVALQIQQNTKMMKANIRQARSDSSVALYSLGATSEIAEIQALEEAGGHSKQFSFKT